MTVAEQLEFYAGLKGVRRREMSKAVNQMIADIGMPDKRHTAAADLSGFNPQLQ